MGWHGRSYNLPAIDRIRAELDGVESTTPGETHRAIRILEGSELPHVAAGVGDILETGTVSLRELSE